MSRRFFGYLIAAGLTARSLIARQVQIPRLAALARDDKGSIAFARDGGAKFRSLGMTEDESLPTARNQTLTASP